MSKKLLKLTRIITACICMCVVFTIISFAETELCYDDKAAIQYAKEHCNDKTEWDGTKQDCVEFVRTCVEAGGIPRNHYKERLKGRGYTVQGYMDYLVDNGYAELNKLKKNTIKFSSGTYYYISSTVNGDKVAPGDILVYKCTGASCGKFFHVALLNIPDKSGTYKNFYRHYAHNVSINNKVVYAIRCSKCKRSPKYTEMYALHITLPKGEVSKAGYRQDGNYYYLFDENGNKRKGTVVYDDYKYSLGTSGKSTLYKAKTKYELNYRTGPSTKYELKGTYKKGKQISIVREKDGWGEMRNGYWVKLLYTKKVAIYPQFIEYEVKTSDYLNYRTGPSTSYKLKGTYKKGKLLTIVEKENGWGKTSTGYWVFLEYTERL